MKQTLQPKPLRHQKSATPLCIPFLVICLLFGSHVSAKSVFNTLGDTVVEKKVDYIERIYFSGKNKEGLNTMILSTLQELDGKPATSAVAKQYAFLSGIQEKADNADNACDVLEILAVGIYSIDANAAVQQDIPKPSNKATDKAEKGLSNINSFGNSTRDLAWSSWYLSGGKINSFATAGKVAGTANAIGNTANTLGTAKRMFDQGKALGKSLGIGKNNNPCKNVPPKDVAIGEHIVPEAANKNSASNSTPSNTVTTSTGTQTNANNANAGSGMKIVIKNITYNQFSAIALALEKVSGITAVNSDDFGGNTGTLLLACSMRTKEVIDRIIQSNPNISFEIENTSTGGANLLVKNKK